PPPADYGYRRPSRRPRRTAGGVVIGTLGGVAALIVVGVLGFALAGNGHEGGAGGDASRLRAGSRTAAFLSPLYRSGALARVDCRLPRIAAHDELSMQRFLDTLSDRLDPVWNRQFATAG